MEQEIRKEQILEASKDITEFLNERYAVDVDYTDIAFFINDHLGYLYDVIDEVLNKLDEQCHIAG